MWKQGWCGGESASLPPLPPLWTGFRSWTWCHMWIEFVISSHPCSKGFSVGPPVFLPWQKTNILNSNSTWQKVDRKSHPTDCPLLISSYFFFWVCVCVCVYCHPCRLCHVWDQSLYTLSREGMGGFLLYHPEINLVPPPSKLCSILMIPSIGRQCSVAPPLYLVSNDSPLLPWKPCDPPSFFLSPPPPRDK